MNADARRLKIDKVTESIIGSAFIVANELGHGFLEKVYENSLALELRSKGLLVDQQRPIDVYFRDQVVGQYVADLVVEGLVLVELKVVEAFNERHFHQCTNYLKATGLTTCLLLNFYDAKVQVKRIVHNF